MPRAPKQTADELRDALDAAERECDSLRRQLAEVAYEHKMSKMLNHGALAENKMLEEKVRVQQETIRVLNVAESKLARTEAALEVAERRIEELEKDRIKEYERTAEAISEARNGWDVEARKSREMEKMEWEAKGREWGREEVARLTKERDAWKAKYATAMAENARLEARFATVRSLVSDTSPAAPAKVAMKRDATPEHPESRPEPEPVSPPVRKRGRPPRQAVVEEPESEVEPDPIESPPVRRRVGRPPKAAAQTQPEPESPPVRKRGRPRKIVDAEPEDEMEPESPPVRRPVGRPRKTAPALLAEAFPTPSRVPPRGAIQYAAKPEAEPDSPPVRRPVGRPRKNAPALLAAAFPTPSRPAGPASAPTTSQRPLKRPRPRASSATRDHDAFVDDDDLDEFGRPGDLESLSPVQRTAQRKLSQAQVRQQLAARSLPSPPSTSNGRTAAAKVTSKESRVVSAFASATVDSGGRAKKVRRVVEEDSDDDPLASWSN